METCVAAHPPVFIFRLMVCRSEILQEKESQGEAAKVLEELSVMLECDEKRVVHKVRKGRCLVYDTCDSSVLVLFYQHFALRFQNRRFSWRVFKVHELKKLAHELFELRDTHVREIQQLKEDATTRASTPASNEMSMDQMFPGGHVAATHDQNAVLQVPVP